MPHSSARRCQTSEQLDSLSLDAHRLAEFCKALAHPVRVSIVSYLKGLDRCFCGQIVEALPLAQSTVSQHLKVLKSAGVITGEIEGPRTCYCLNPGVVDELKALVALL